MLKTERTIPSSLRRHSLFGVVATKKKEKKKEEAQREGRRRRSCRSLQSLGRRKKKTLTLFFFFKSDSEKLQQNFPANIQGEVCCAPFVSVQMEGVYSGRKCILTLVQTLRLCSQLSNVPRLTHKSTNETYTKKKKKAPSGCTVIQDLS